MKFFFLVFGIKTNSLRITIFSMPVDLEKLLVERIKNEDLDGLPKSWYKPVSDEVDYFRISLNINILAGSRTQAVYKFMKYLNEQIPKSTMRIKHNKFENDIFIDIVENARNVQAALNEYIDHWFDNDTLWLEESELAINI